MAYQLIVIIVWCGRPLFKLLNRGGTRTTEGNLFILVTYGVTAIIFFMTLGLVVIALITNHLMLTPN